jgi:hypothetical protein
MVLARWDGGLQAQAAAPLALDRCSREGLCAIAVLVDLEHQVPDRVHRGRGYADELGVHSIPWY